MSDKVLEILNWVGIAATCIGAICGGLAKFNKVQGEVKKEVAKQLEDKQEGVSYNKVAKQCK